MIIWKQAGQAGLQGSIQQVRSAPPTCDARGKLGAARRGVHSQNIQRSAVPQADVHGSCEGSAGAVQGAGHCISAARGDVRQPQAAECVVKLGGAAGGSCGAGCKQAVDGLVEDSVSPHTNDACRQGGIGCNLFGQRGLRL